MLSTEFTPTTAGQVRVSGMTSPRFSRPLGGASAVLLLGALAACAPEPAVPPASSPDTQEPEASRTPTPTAPAEPEEASCEGLLDLTTLDAILSTGYDVLPVNGYLDKIRAEGSPYALFDEYGGLVCPVNNGSRVTELYAYSPISAENQATQEARLVAEGWTASDHDGGTLYETAPSEGIVFAFYFRNGFWWCGYDPGVIDMIVANSPES